MTDSFNQPLISQEDADGISQFASAQLQAQQQYAARLAQQKFMQAMALQQKNEVGAEITGLGIPASLGVISKAYNSQAGQQIVGRLRTAYNDYQETGSLEGAYQKTIQRLKDEAMEKVNTIKNEAQAKVESTVGDVKNTVQNQVQNARDTVNGKISDLQQQAQDLRTQAEGQVDDVRNNLQSRAEDLENQANDLRTSAEDGAEGVDIDGEDLMGGLIGNLRTSLNNVVTAGRNTVSRAVNQVDNIDPVDSEFGTDTLMQEVNPNSIVSSFTRNPAQSSTSQSVSEPLQEGTEMKEVASDSFSSPNSTTDTEPITGAEASTAEASTAAEATTGAEIGSDALEGAVATTEGIGGLLDASGIGAVAGLTLGVVGGIISAVEGLKDLFGHHSDEPEPPPPPPSPTAEMAVQIGTS